MDTPGSVFLEVQVNGKTIPSFSEDLGTQYIAVQGPEDPITWNFYEAGRWPGGYEGRRDDLWIRRMIFREELPDSPYTTWLKKYTESTPLNNELLQLDGDANDDGVNNYLSYLLDESPFKPVVLLGIVAREKDQGISIWHPSFPENLADSFIIEYAGDLNGIWEDATGILSEPYTIPENPDTSYCDVIDPSIDAESLFFRIRYVDFIPNLDNLLHQ